ncbi:MAG TPA: DUF6062 family protein [Candidatus Saccharimonadales bacterium]|nr:DUF6062 family protein [Candidatus Saccharimonadales bacterium]
MTAERLPARDLVDVRLAEAMAAGGCPMCGVRARSERGTLDAIIAERVLDLGFREGLERQHAFCRRHAAELIVADRRSAGVLGSAILYGAMLERRLAVLRGAMTAKGRTRRSRLGEAARRPSCQVCGQAEIAVATAAARLVDRAGDPAWATATRSAPFCLDDLTTLLAAAGDVASFQPIADAQLTGLETLRAQLEGYVHNSAQDRRQHLTDEHRQASDEAARRLGGS